MQMPEFNQTSQFILQLKMGGQDQKKQSNLDYKDVQNGPLTEANRQCRDIFCCLLYIGIIFLMVYLTIHAYSVGQPSNLFRPIAKQAGNTVVCGDATYNTKDYPYLYISNLQNMDAMRYCVASCPTYNSAGTFPTTWPASGGVTITWVATLDGSGVKSASFSSSQDVGYDSSLAFDRLCLPAASVFTGAFSAQASSFKSLQQGDLANFILDIKNNWQLLLAAFGFAILVSFIFMYCLRCLAGCIVWLSIFGTIIVFVLIGIIFLYNAGLIPAIGQYKGTFNIPTISEGGQQYYDIYGYICFGFAGLLLIITLCCCSRIRLAVAVCKAAGQFVVAVCMIVLVPIFQTLILLGFWVACLAVMIYLVSAASFVVVNSTDYFTSVGSYQDPSLDRLYIFIFTTFWGNAMIQAIGTFVIASACAMWYYNHGAQSILDFPILRSYKMAFRYHFGSLAFGSFILAVVNFLQLIVELFKKQAESSGAANSKCFEYAINCMRCCLACVQRIVQFLNKTAYIQIAIRGKNFCLAAKDGFELVWSNGLRYAIVSGVGQIMMFIGKIAIAAATTGAFYCLIIYNPTSKINVLQPIYLLIIVFIMSFAVAMVFMAVYSLAMDTLLACFIIDEANQKAKGNKVPQYAPPELAQLMETD